MPSCSTSPHHADQVCTQRRSSWEALPVSCWVPERPCWQQKPHKERLLLAAAAPPQAAGPSRPPRAGLLSAALGDASAEPSMLPPLLLLERTCPSACPSWAGACSGACAPGGLGVGDWFMARDGKLSWSSLGGACMLGQVQSANSMQVDECILDETFPARGKDVWSACRASARRAVRCRQDHITAFQLPEKLSRVLWRLHGETGGV